MKKITPVLLAGGSGTRLWPLSRKSYPKQFSNLIGDTSLFQQSALRLTTSVKVEFTEHITLTNSDYRFIVGEQLQSVGIDPGPILIEPEGKNTGPAILAASLYAESNDSDAILLVAPSDHVIKEVNAFHDAIQVAIQAVESGKIVTFGINPTRPETGYGYLELSEVNNCAMVEVKGFIEKPVIAQAQAMIEAGNYLWNAGIFMFRAKDMVNAFKIFSPDLFTQVRQALDDGEPDLGFFRLNPKDWAQCENISIDYAIMERANNLVVVPFSAGWSDLGDWDAVWREMWPDENGLVESKNAHAFNCQNTLLRSENGSQEIVGLGLKDIVAIAMPDAVLVADKSQVQNLKYVISELKSKNVSQAETFPIDYRPWGWFESLTIRDRFQVKQITVMPDAALSLQSHHHRSEHWIVVEGTAKVNIDDDVKLLSEGQSVYIPLGAHHRLQNPGKVPMVLIEVQTGTYLGEDDIIRYEDLYSRD
ncbi:mannose-1-phosphate guanylyltransferase/mannose-6-phosphate isomerase [Planktomarina sp.]|nr:mannose-1-phosphate guanylyltransferase/mannose-6-phosphate isomerase [Planktomarina sp.]